MKLQLLLIALLSALLFTACQKEEVNCRDNTLAVYKGQDNDGNEGSIELKEGTGEKGVIAIMTIEDANGTPFSFNMTGELNENCSTLTLPSQNIGIGTLSGIFAITNDGNKMDGTVTNSSGDSFALNLTRQ